MVDGDKGVLVEGEKVLLQAPQLVSQTILQKSILVYRHFFFFFLFTAQTNINSNDYRQQYQHQEQQTTTTTATCFFSVYYY
jgi:hypothetical protein